jgi:peptidylprolyl isomerase
MAASAGDKVSVHYTGRLDDGTVFDSSQGRDPLEFTLGTQSVITGFELAVLGLEVGERRTVVVGPEDAYGVYHQDRVAVVDRSVLPDEITPEVGMILRGEGQNGEMLVTITDVSDDRVTLDGNHPLAGKQLTFEIELAGINKG